MAHKFHPLSSEEVARLTAQLCTCDDWSKIEVAEGFNAARVKSTHFSGSVKLGVFDGQASFSSGLKKPAGISNVTIHNCTIGDNVYINQVGNYIANYLIEDDVVIENVDLLAVDGQTSFGNGTDVAVINEAGGREIPIYDHLSAHTAYIIALYRHRPRAVENLRKMIADYTASVTSNTGLIGKAARIINCRIIQNVKIGPACVIEGATRLENGSINSCFEHPVHIGAGVLAEDFICASGSKVTDGVILSRCFVGQGTDLGKQYSAENSVFFANCGGFHGEACSIFAGPYTVTHHKSTLLIAGLFSFLNAGSGTNQSNHMYKLGPNHQGIVERGSKTASDSYLQWPARIGAFTTVIGRHCKNPDTSDLPFSCLIEQHNESILIPAVNLRKVGTVRDARKWPKRDLRKDPNKLDFINFKLLSPYTIQKMLSACRILEKFKTVSPGSSTYLDYQNVKIKPSSLDEGIRLYHICIDKFLGNCLIKRLEGRQFKNVNELRSALNPETATGVGKWIDLAGLLAPEESVQKLLDDIESSRIGSLQQLAETFLAIHENYPAYEWTWAANTLRQSLGKNIGQITADDIISVTTKWKSAVVELDRMLYEDAKKEFAVPAQIGFGIDGDEKTKQLDFEQVRGSFEKNSFVAEIQEHIIKKPRLGDELISRMEKIR